MDQVKILSRKLIPPSSPTPPHLQNLKVSSFDLLIYPVYSSTVFYYPASCSGRDQVKENAKRSEQLQKSLSEILAIYYPLAGRYVDDKYLIECNDKGAEYLEAHVSGSLSEFMERAEYETELRNLLVPYIYQPPNSPQVGVQFNIFECGGIAIGASVTHRIADGFTKTMFVKNWANACRLGIDKANATPNFELGSIYPPIDIPTSHTVPTPKDEKKIVMRRFLFNNSTIAKLKAVANANCNDPELLKRQAKGAELVMALIWKTLITVSGIKHGRMRPSVLVLPYNLRRNTTVLPQNCCGNLVRIAVSEEFVPNKDGKEVGLLDLVGHLRKTARKGYAECEKSSTAEELFLLTTDAVKVMNDATSKGEADVFVFNNMHGLPLYQNDFGWGKPHRVQLAFYPFELGFFMDAKDGDGIEVSLRLEEKTMLLLLKNQDIVAFTSHGISKL